jgi:hypothetical protein
MHLILANRKPLLVGKSAAVPPETAKADVSSRVRNTNVKSDQRCEETKAEDLARANLSMLKTSRKWRKFEREKPTLGFFLYSYCTKSRQITSPPRIPSRQRRTSLRTTASSHTPRMTTHQRDSLTRSAENSAVA